MRRKTQASAQVGDIYGAYHCRHKSSGGACTLLFPALDKSQLAVPVVAAVAIHNIPEGIAVSTPVFFATGSRSKAFWYSFLSGLAEPLGAIAVI